MGIRTRVAEYIKVLNETSPHAPVNRTHEYLRGLNQAYGSLAVDDEVRRQFAERKRRLR